MVPPCALINILLLNTLVMTAYHHTHAWPTLCLSAAGAIAAKHFFVRSTHKLLVWYERGKDKNNDAHSHGAEQVCFFAYADIMCRHSYIIQWQTLICMVHSYLTRAERMQSTKADQHINVGKGFFICTFNIMKKYEQLDNLIKNNVNIIHFLCMSS